MTLCTECGRNQAVIEVKPRRFCPVCAETYIRGILAVSQEKAEMYGKERVRAEGLASEVNEMRRFVRGKTYHAADCGHTVTTQTRIDAGGKSYCPDCAEKAIETLKRNTNELGQELFDMCWQHCYVDGKVLDTMCLSSNEDALALLEKYGYVEEAEPDNNRLYRPVKRTD